jgi:hypothetical protein
MAKTGGARPGAGRPKGSLSRRHVEVLAGATASGLTPVEYMLSIMRDEAADEKRRAWAAEKAAPFIHPRPTPIAQPIEIDLPDTTTLEGMKDALGRILSAVATGQIAPGEAQSLSALIEYQRKVIETSDLAARIEKLESEVTARS